MARPLRLIAPPATGLLLVAVLAGSASPQQAPAPAPPPASSPPVAAPASADPPATSSSQPASPAAPRTDAPAPAPALPGLAFPVEEYRLSNGLRVILAPDPALPNVAVHVSYDVGSRDDPEGLGGIAHLVEHLLFERSAHVPKGAFARLLTAAGAGDMNGATSHDTTRYYETVPPERLDLALWLESDRMGFFLPAVDEAALEQERRVVMNELRVRHRDTTAGIALAEAYAAAFRSWHPYHGLPAGTEDQIRSITLADVKAFFATWYGPANATLTLAGRFERDRAVALVERYFATLPARPPPRRPALPPLERKGETRVEIAANVGADLVRLVWVTPAFGQPGDVALDRVATLLAVGEGARLEKRLRVPGLATSFSALQASEALASVFTIQAVAARGVSAEKLIAAIDRELADIRTLGPTDQEMARIASGWATAEMFNIETALGRAGHLSAVAGLGPLPLPFDWGRQRRRPPTAPEIRQAVVDHVAPEARAAVVITRYLRGAPVGGVVTDTETP